MENTEEFESWLYKLLLDAKRTLNISDKIIAYVLLRAGINYYLRQLVVEELNEMG